MISRRRGLFAAVILLLLAAGTVIYLRLDIPGLEQQSMASVIRTTGGRIQVERASFSLLHATLRLQGVKLENAANNWAFSADEVQVNLKLWPLLFGEARPSTIYLISPTLNLTAPEPLPGIGILVQAVPDLHVDRLIVREGTITMMGAPYTDQTELDIRRTSRGNNLLVEVRAAIGKGEISFNGHAERDGKAPGRMFGKIEMDHVPIADLLGHPSPLPGYGVLGTALTYDISEDRSWQLFGDITLNRDDKTGAPITLRGKLKGSGQQQLAWKEGFIRIGDNATITTDGTCTEENGCAIHAKTNHLPLSAVAKAWGIKATIEGSAKGSATLNWHRGIWLADANTTLEKVKWSDIDFPEMHVAWSGIRHQPGRTGIASVDITQPKQQGHITVEKIESDETGWGFSATVGETDGWWASIANALLALQGQKPLLQGDGILSAKINAVPSEEGGEAIAFEANADQAELAYGKQFTKPKGVSASISGNLQTGPQGDQFTISAAQLGDSTLHQLQWQHRGDRQSLGIREALLDFSALHAKGIRLPAAFDTWRGNLKGNLGSHTFRTRESRAAWLADLDATLRLQGFGTAESHWDGALRVKNGLLYSGRMTWHGAGGEQAVASGTLNLANHKGRVNLTGASFVWPQGEALPAWLNDASIKGRIQADRFEWAGNGWEELKAGYRLQGNQITLRKLSASLAGGSMSSDRLVLTLKPDSVHFSGPVRMGLVRLHQIKGLSPILGAAPRGYLYTNAFLEGDLPFNGLATWKGNGDIEIQRGGWRGGDFTLSLPNRGSGKRDAYRFSRASSHFHIAPEGIDLSDLQIEAGNAIADGAAHLDANGALSGTIHIKDEQGILNGSLQGVWPHIEVSAP